MQHSAQHHEVTAPKQCKLLGAKVRGLGLVMAVSSTLSYGYTLVEGAARVNRRVAFTDLKRSGIEFPLEHRQVSP